MRSVNKNCSIFNFPISVSRTDNVVTGLHNSYPRVIAALKVLLKLVYRQGSSPFVWYDRGISEYFTKQ